MRSLSFANISMATTLAFAASIGWAQLPDSVQRSSSPQGFQVQGGNSTATAAATNSRAGAVGKEAASTSTTQTATGKGGVQIQGTTRINAAATSTTATAVGSGNKAGNELGAIGSK